MKKETAIGKGTPVPIDETTVTKIYEACSNNINITMPAWWIRHLLGIPVANTAELTFQKACELYKEKYRDAYNESADEDYEKAEKWNKDSLHDEERGKLLLAMLEKGKSFDEIRKAGELVIHIFERRIFQRRLVRFSHSEEQLDEIREFTICSEAEFMTDIMLANVGSAENIRHIVKDFPKWHLAYSLGLHTLIELAENMEELEELQGKYGIENESSVEDAWCKKRLVLDPKTDWSLPGVTCTTFIEAKKLMENGDTQDDTNAAAYEMARLGTFNQLVKSIPEERYPESFILGKKCLGLVETFVQAKKLLDKVWFIDISDTRLYWECAIKAVELAKTKEHLEYFLEMSEVKHQEYGNPVRALALYRRIFMATSVKELMGLYRDHDFTPTSIEETWLVQRLAEIIKK